MGSLCVNRHDMCFRLLTPQQAPLFEQSSGEGCGGAGWGQRRVFILAEIPSCIRAHLLWSALAALRVIENSTENGI